MPVNKITVDDCQAWCKSFYEQFAASRSNAALGIIKNLFEIATEQSWIFSNPANKLERRAQYKTDEDHRIDPDEIPTEVQ